MLRSRNLAPRVCFFFFFFSLRNGQHVICPNYFFFFFKIWWTIRHSPRKTMSSSSASSSVIKGGSGDQKIRVKVFLAKILSFFSLKNIENKILWTGITLILKTKHILKDLKCKIKSNRKNFSSSGLLFMV